MAKKRKRKRQTLLQTPYTSPLTTTPKIKGRKTGAVKAPMDRVVTPLDRITASSPYPRPKR